MKAARFPEWILTSLPDLINISITASYIILAIILIRVLFRKAPKRLVCAMWGIAALRLMLPFSIESVFSLIPSAQTIQTESLRYQGSALKLPAVIDMVTNPVYPQNLSVELNTTVDVLQNKIMLFTFIWMAGAALMLLYAVISSVVLKRKVSTATLFRPGIKQTDAIDSPFLYGIFKPIIYIPYSVSAGDMEYVIAHEQAHIKRRDHLWKPLGFIILSVYWFNPIIWVAYMLLCKDIEAACDEKVIKDMTDEDRRSYSTALLNCSVKRPLITACPLAFGELSVKDRIKNVMNYKKPGFWMVIAAVVICTVLAVCFLTDPKTPGYGTDPEWLSQFGDSIDDAVDQASLEYFHNDRADRNHSFCVTSHKTLLLADSKDEQTFTVYAWVLYQEYVPKQEGDFVVASEESGTSAPAAITFLVNDETETIESVLEYWMPRDGSYYTKDLKAKFPEDAYNKLGKENAFVKELKEINLEKANTEFMKLSYTQESFDALIDEICSSPQFSSGTGDYIKAHPNEYANLLQYGELGLQYIFEEYLSGGQTGLRGQILRCVLDDLAPDEIEKISTTNGQEYFDMWLLEAQRLSNQNGLEWVEKYRPAMYLLLQIVENTAVKTGWVWPCDSNRISVPFGKRVHPIANETEDCKHINIVGEKGDPVYAAYSGEVVRAEYSTEYGYYIEIKHTEEIRSQYWHLSEIDVNVGDQVLSGDIIGQIGASGMATGPNLGFVISENDIPVNPMSYYVAYDGVIIQEDKTIDLSDGEINAAKAVAISCYSGTVFEVNSIKYIESGTNALAEGECNFIVNVSKDGIVQEVNRIITLNKINGSWEVVNEGY